MSTAPPPHAPHLPERVLFVLARGGGPGHTAMLRELIERLSSLGVETAVVTDIDHAMRALRDAPATLAVIDVDDANQALATTATIASRIEGVVHHVLDAAPVALATRPSAALILTCLRAGATTFVDLGADSFEAAIHLLSHAARERLRLTTSRRVLEQLRVVVEELLRDLVKTERRSIDLERRLAELGADDAGVAADLDDQRAPVVLLVEDDRELSDHLVDHLEHVGLTTVAFVTGEEAVAHGDRMVQHGEALDLVIVDRMLPGIDGLEVVRRLRKDRPNLAAFLITGFADPTVSARATDLGVVGVAVKPFDDVRAVVARLRDEATAAMARTREQGYLLRIKARHEAVLDQYRVLLAELAQG